MYLPSWQVFSSSHVIREKEECVCLKGERQKGRLLIQTEPVYRNNRSRYRLIELVRDESYAPK